MRKTMFDDCKGSNFEELLAVFSSAVLIKAMDRGGRNKCIVQKSIGLAMLPLDVQSLTLAYQVSLAKHLRIRTVLERRLLKFSRTLEVQNDLLERRSELVKSRAISKRIPQRNILNLNKFVSEQWIDNSKWIEVLLRGDRHRSKGDLLDLSFADVWQHACNDTLYAIRPKQHESCLQSLENRMQEQKSRLDRWKTTQAMLAARKQRHSPINKTYATHNDQPPVRKYSLRSYGAPLPAEPLLPAANPRKVSATADDSCLSQGNSKRGIHHRSSKSVSSRAPPADIDSSIHISATRKPLANTGVRLSSTIQMPAPQDHHPAFSTRPTTSQQSLENTPISIPRADFKTIEAHDEPTPESTVYSPYTNPTPYRPSLSLAERTKLSMTKRTDSPAKPPDNTFSLPATTARLATVTLGDLAQRTRQSMLNRQSHTTIQQSTKPLVPTTTYPINQVNNRKEPPAPAAATAATATATAAMATEEEESLFDETIIDLDEVDIFKSRPKVALSPVPTPTTAERVALSVIVPADESYEDDFS